MKALAIILVLLMLILIGFVPTLLIGGAGALAFYLFTMKKGDKFLSRPSY